MLTYLLRAKIRSGFRGDWVAGTGFSGDGVAGINLDHPCGRAGHHSHGNTGTLHRSFVL